MTITKMYKSLCCAITFLLISTLETQAIAGPTYNNYTVVLPSQIKVGNQIFDATAGGFDDYYETLVTDDPKLAKQLRPDFHSLIVKRNWGYVALGTGLVAGLTLMIGSYSFLATKTTIDGLTTTRLNLPAAGAGAALVCLGWAAYAFISPGRTDFLKVINKHNKLNLKTPMELNLGLDWMPSDSGPLAYFHLSF